MHIRTSQESPAAVSRWDYEYPLVSTVSRLESHELDLQMVLDHGFDTADSVMLVLFLSATFGCSPLSELWAVQGRGLHTTTSVPGCTCTSVLESASRLNLFVEEGAWKLGMTRMRRVGVFRPKYLRLES